jgi:ATP-dependent Clp protease ATP-binding subunit ClpB
MRSRADYASRIMHTASQQTRSTLNDLDAFLRRRILGQDQVVPRIVSVLRRGQLGLTKSGRPRGSFLFLGPTGVGKTEITLTFTEFLMGCDQLSRFDMSEYQTQESLALLLGGNASERGTLGAVVSKSGGGTLLFDEIEKAHPRILDIFLQILDAARVTTASGETLDLSGFYVVFTSNIGSAELMNLQHSSFATMERHVLTRAQQSLRPELYARITEKLVFNRLTYDIQLEIAALLLTEELTFLRTRGHELSPASEVLSFIVRRGFHPRLGARPMRDAVEKLVGDAVAERLLTSGAASGRLVVRDGAERLTIADCKGNE